MAQIDRTATGIDKYFVKVVRVLRPAVAVRPRCRLRPAAPPAQRPPRAAGGRGGGCPRVAHPRRYRPHISTATLWYCPQVPTDFYTLWGRKTHTYQYSVTEYYHQFRGGEEQPPAVYLL